MRAKFPNITSHMPAAKGCTRGLRSKAFGIVGRVFVAIEITRLDRSASNLRRAATRADRAKAARQMFQGNPVS